MILIIVIFRVVGKLIKNILALILLLYIQD